MKHVLPLVLMLAACSNTHGTGPDGSSVTPDAGRPPLGPSPPPASELDLLFMVDNSCSMTEEQANLTAELPYLLRTLLTGDADGDGFADRKPFDSVHIAAITTDLGTGGFTVPTCANPSFGEDGVMRTTGLTYIRGCQATYPSFLEFQPSGMADVDATDAACVATVGTAGCGFEQQLEAPLKALSPSVATAWTAEGYVPPRFFMNTSGHGDGANAGFLRADSTLAIVLVSEEEDCSARDGELFNPTSATYTADLNLRCYSYPEALHPIERYVDGFTQLRRDPRRLVFLPIVGVPFDLQPALGDAPDYEALLSDDPDVRDPRMQERVDPAMPTRLEPSCNEPGTGLAFPPVRIVRVARALGARGAHTSVASICHSRQRSAIDILLALLRP